MKSSNTAEDTPKSSQSKVSKKSTKSRSKSSKSDVKSSGGGAGASSSGNSINSAAGGLNSNNIVTPTTPTTSNVSGSIFETASLGAATAGSSNGAVTASSADSGSNSRQNHTKLYATLEPRTVKIIWEQHDQSDIELSSEVCTRMAEDASYKLWELINNVKTYARHSGGTVTYDLVNEVLRDADVPPVLGAMDSEWDRIDYDDSYFFYSDKILELRDEYQKDVTIHMPDGPDFNTAYPLEDKNTELLKKYIPSLIYVALYGDANSLDSVLQEVTNSPLMGSCYRVLLAKLIQILAFKQNDAISMRCWRLLRSCSFNAQVRYVDCREQYFHLAEILICQLIAPYESIKLHGVKQQPHQTEQHPHIKMEIDEVKLEQQLDIKAEFMEHSDAFHAAVHADNAPVQEEKIYRLQADEDDDNDNDNDVTMLAAKLPEVSPYFATPVDLKYVAELCETIGELAAINGYFQQECIYHITRRLQRFFEGRSVGTEREYNYISRAVRGLIALGEYAFREFIPFTYNLKVDDIPDSLRNEFAVAALFLHGADDIFLYEWLECVAGADKLQPFQVYYAQYHEKLLTYRFLHRKTGTFKVNPKLGVRRLEWSTLAAAMCHGDDPNKALKPKPTLQQAFPELVAPNLHLNRAGTIRFKFAGCRPVIIKPKVTTQSKVKTEGGAHSNNTHNAQNDILIARRKLFKPLTNERRIVPLSSYYFLRI